MFVLITYDINVTSLKGTTRLRKVSKICMNYGQRVQNSVFECKLTEAELLRVKKQLLDMIDINTDSLRFYRLGENYEKKVEHVGAKSTYRIDETLII